MSEKAAGSSIEYIGFKAFQESEGEVLRRISELVDKTGSVTQAVDMYAVERADITASAWAGMTDRTPSTVRQSVKRARDSFSDE